MPEGVLFGGSVLAAAVAGAVALFAPCCISVMLPAYFASSFQNRRALVAMTFLFAAGIATVILPIAFGAQALRRVFIGQHTAIYLVMGVLLFAMAIYLLLGGKMQLPMPGRRAGARGGPLGVYTLGAFSGVASSCCAPVLAGVIALSGVAASFGAALGLGTAYVFGMVMPLFVISLLWDRYDWKSTRLFRPKSVTWRIGRVSRTISGINLASGLLLAAMGLFTIGIGLVGQPMPASASWQARFSGRLQHYGKVLVDALSWIPGWAAGLILILGVALLARLAVRQIGSRSIDGGDGPLTPQVEVAEPVREESTVEH